MLKLVMFILGFIAFIFSLLSIFTSVISIMYLTLFFLGIWMLSLGLYSLNDERMVGGLSGLIVGAGSLFILGHHILQLI